VVGLRSMGEVKRDLAARRRPFWGKSMLKRGFCDAIRRELQRGVSDYP